MAFNHYAKIKRILDSEPSGWCIKKVDSPTIAKNFRNENIKFPYYYRIYTVKGEPIKYCKFQQIDRLAKILDIAIDNLVVV